MSREFFIKKLETKLEIILKRVTNKNSNFIHGVLLYYLI